MMADANVEVVRRAIENPTDPDVFSDDLLWHFTGRVPGFASEYHGWRAFLSEFLGKIMDLTGGSFTIDTLDIRGAGSELVVAHLRISMTLGGTFRSGDDVVVYRVIDGKVVEAFDIPSHDIG